MRALFVGEMSVPDFYVNQLAQIRHVPDFARGSPSGIGVQNAFPRGQDYIPFQQLIQAIGVVRGERLTPMLRVEQQDKIQRVTEPLLSCGLARRHNDTHDQDEQKPE